MKRIIDRMLSYFMLLTPFVLSLLLLFMIQSMPETSGHGSGYLAVQQGGQMKDRVSIMVILEIFALTLIIRPWEFPWKPSRFWSAAVVCFLWGSLVVPMSMHMGRLMGIHALGMMAVMGILPTCAMLLWGRNMIDGSRSP